MLLSYLGVVDELNLTSLVRDWFKSFSYSTTFNQYRAKQRSAQLIKLIIHYPSTPPRQCLQEGD